MLNHYYKLTYEKPIMKKLNYLFIIVVLLASCKKEETSIDPSAAVVGNYSGSWQKIVYNSAPEDIKFTITGSNSNVIITVPQSYRSGWESGQPINGTINSAYDLTLNSTYNITGLNKTLTGTGYFSKPTLILEYDVVDYHTSQGGYTVTSKYKITATKI